MDCKQKRMGLVGCFGQIENIKRQSLDYFNRFIIQGKLPEDVKNYLHRRWAEIQTYEACADYGLLSRCSL